MRRTRRDNLSTLSRVRTRQLVALFAALALSLTLTGCGSEDTPETAGNSIPGTQSIDDVDDPSDSGQEALPEQLRDFPLPSEYKVRTAGGEGNSATAILYDIADSWTELKAFYESELPKAGWQMLGDRPFVGKEGTELDASKGDTSVTVGITSINNETGLVINLVGP